MTELIDNPQDLMDLKQELKDFRFNATEKRLELALMYIQLLKQNERYLNGLKADMQSGSFFFTSNYFKNKIAKRDELQLFMFNRLKQLL